MATVQLSPELVFQQLGNEYASLYNNKRIFAAIPDGSLLDSDEETLGLERVQCFLSKSEIAIVDVLASQWNILHKDGRPWRSRVLRRLAQGHTLADAVKAQEECRSLQKLVKQQAASITRLQQEKREIEGKARIGRKQGKNIHKKKCDHTSFVNFSILTGQTAKTVALTQRKHHLKVARDTFAEAIKKMQTELCADTPEQAIKEACTTR